MPIISIVKNISVFLSLVFLFSCSSNSFYQRQYLKGRYVDKIHMPVNNNSKKYSEFKLQEFTLSADNGETELSIIFNEDTIPKVLADSTSAIKANGNKSPSNNEDVIYFSPDSLLKINKSEVNKVIEEPDLQEKFNAQKKRLSRYVLFSWIFRLLFYVGIITILISSTISSSFVFPLMLLSFIITCVFWSISILYNYRAFREILEIEKLIYNKLKAIKNKAWYYLLFIINFYITIVALIFLLVLLLYSYMFVLHLLF